MSMIERIETKAALSIDDAGTITGVAWPFNAGPDRVGDVIERKAFNVTSQKLAMLYGHDPNQPIGVWDLFVETNDGLQVTGKMLVDDVARAREVRALVKAGAINGLSIGFVTKAATPRRGGGRTITKLDLYEISIVPVPSHPRARITGAKDATAAIAIAEAINRAAVALRN